MAIGKCESQRGKSGLNHPSILNNPVGDALYVNSSFYIFWESIVLSLQKN